MSLPRRAAQQSLLGEFCVLIWQSKESCLLDERAEMKC